MSMTVHDFIASNNLTFELHKPNYTDNINYTTTDLFVIIDVSGSTNDLGGRNRIRGEQTDNPVTKTKTKPVIMAELEGCAIILSYLTLCTPNSNLYLMSFDSVLNMPDEYPIKLNDLFLTNLPKLIKYTQGGTHLSCATNKVLEIVSKNREDTLIIIITDGQTDDPDETIKSLINISNILNLNEKRLDIFTIGAGSINSSLMSSNRVQPPLLVGNQRHTYYSHIIRGGTYHSSAQCNIGYLQALTEFKTFRYGRGKYSGAYLDYDDLQKACYQFLSGEDDGMDVLWIESDIKGYFYSPKSHQYEILTDYLMNGNKNYSKNGVNVTIDEIDEMIYVTDEYGKGRYYLYVPKKDIAVRHYKDYLWTIETDDEKIKKLIQTIKNS